MTEGFLKHILDPKEIIDALTEVSRMARRENIKIALGGGVAMQAHGSDRFTKDVDFLVDRLPGDVLNIKKLSFGGVRSRTSSGTPVDFILRDDDYQLLYEEALDRSKSDPEIGVPVVSAEHMAAIKLAAGREKDMLDLRILIKLGNLDLVRTRKIVKQHLGIYAAKELDAFVIETEWLKSRGKE